jgi:hypothetical protein
MVRVGIVVLGLCTIVFPQQGVGPAVVGTVYTERNVPLPGANVFVVPDDSRFQAVFPLRSVTTDRSGRFTFTSLPPMTYRIFAMKEEEDYPNTFFSFYSNDRVDKLQVEDSKTAEVTLHVFKAGRIEGTVRGQNHEQLTGTFLLQRVANPSFSVTAAFPSNFSVLVPAGTPVEVKVSADGFQDWYYSKQGALASHTPLTVAAGEHRRIDVVLSRSATH